MKRLNLGVLIALAMFSAKAFGVDTFGASIKQTKIMKLSEVLANSDKLASKEVLTSGKVERVCQKKGCWMIIKDGDQQVRVTFKGYKFFMPLSIAGKTIKAQGLVSVKTQSVDEQKHFLKDEGRPQADIDKITKPLKTFAFVASGVEVQSLK